MSGLRTKDFLTIAYVDLSSQSYSIGKIEKEIRDKTLGGRGLNAYLIASLLLSEGKQAIPNTFDDPKNIIYISPGILAGTQFPSTGRTTISVLKNPVTGMVGDGNLGGHFGPALRLCGIDSLVIEGKSNEMVCLFISKDGKLSFIDAGRLGVKGTGIWIADMLIKTRFDPNVKSLLIGPAGENLCFSAVPICELRTAGGNGTGAVFGSKNLKGIIVEYYQEKEKSILPSSKNLDEKFKSLCINAEEKIRSHPVYDTFRKYGTTSLVEIHSGMDYLPTKNWTERNDKNWKKLSGRALHKLYEELYGENYIEEAKESGSIGCRNCPIVCCNPDKIEYETLNCLGSKLGISDLRWLKIINDTYFNDAGLDVIQTTSIISTLMELYDKGISDYKIEWGDYSRVIQFISSFSHSEDEAKITNNDVVASYFKQGFKKGLKRLVEEGKIKLNIEEDTAEEKVNNAYKNYYIHIKGNALSGVFPDIERNKGVSLAVATSSRGADHLRSLPTLATYADWYFKSRQKFNKIKKAAKLIVRAGRTSKGDMKILMGDLYETYVNLFEVPREIVNIWKERNFLFDRKTVDGWEYMIDFTQNMYALSDSLSLCRFVTPWRFGLGPERLAEALTTLTGSKFTWRDLIDVGRRTYTLERYFAYLYRKYDEEVDASDSLPRRFFKNSQDEETFKKLLKNYYDLCGYDETGAPKTQTVKECLADLKLPSEKKPYTEIKREELLK